MRTTRSAFLLALALVTATAGAAGPVSTSITNTKHLERAVEHQINRHMIFPLSAEEGEMCGEVRVSYAVDVNGRLVVLKATSKNEALRAYVLEKLGKVHVGPNATGLWNITHVRFTFRPE